MLITKLVGSTAGSVAQLEYYGTQEGSVPIQIGGGNIDKVANFRVYDKFIGEDQALEIWDAQKDEFGRAKSSMTLQKGRLGIGTTEPEGRLAVADEPDPTTYGLQEFPPRGMGGYKTYFEGHGEFCVSTSSFAGPQNFGTKDLYPWYAFNKTSTYGWVSTNSHSGGLPTSSAANRFGILGEWLEIEMPSKIKLNNFTLSLGYDGHNPTGTNTSRFPKVFNLYKSNDGITWTSAMEITTPTAPTEGAYGTTYTYNINESEYYNRYLIQVKQTHSDTSGYSSASSHTAIGEWRLFGYREQLPPKQSVLHDGQLTLTKNLTVPRIGPALDADDTPRRDRLVVEYNTSTNPTFEGVVRDTSGRGNDGVFYGNTYYDATTKALDFDGSTDYIMGSLGNVGDIDFTVSLWFKKNTSGTVGLLWNFGGSGGTGNPEDSVALEVGSGNNLDYFIFSGAYGAISNFALSYVGQWVHIVATRSGNDLKIYLDGVDQNMSITGTDTLQLARNSEFTIGARGTGALGTNSLDGCISNFKIYDLALTASEAKTLYDMGRCDEGHHMVNFSKTRVGIGLGDGNFPRSLLDVGGEPVGPGSRPAFLISKNGSANRQWGSVNSTYTTIYASPLPIFAESELVYNINNCLSFGDYASRKYIKFTAPADGIYNFGLAIGLLRNVHSAADYVAFGLKVNLEGAYSSTTSPGGDPYTNMDYFFEEINTSEYASESKKTVNGTINVKLLKGDFVTYYSRSVENSEVVASFSAWGHIVHYL